MAVQVKADDLGYAILLKEIGSREDAIYVRDHLIAGGLNPVISAVCENGYHILLHGVSCEAFVNAIAAADVDLI
jgi:hypothetical protein